MESKSKKRRICLTVMALLPGAAVLMPLAISPAVALAAPAPRVHPGLPATVHITDFPTAHNTFPGALTSGPGGDLWFTRDVSDSDIGSFDPVTHSFNYYQLNQGIYAFKA